MAYRHRDPDTQPIEDYDPNHPAFTLPLDDMAWAGQQKAIPQDYPRQATPADLARLLKQGNPDGAIGKDGKPMPGSIPQPWGETAKQGIWAAVPDAFKVPEDGPEWEPNPRGMIRPNQPPIASNPVGEIGGAVTDMLTGGATGWAAKALAGKGLATFMGVGARNADLKALARAKKMKAAGATPEETVEVTGWSDKFADGKWKWEISDKDADLKPAVKEELLKMEAVNAFLRNRGQGSAQKSWTGDLGDFFKHDEFFEGYPQAKKATVDARLTGSGNSGNSGYFQATPQFHGQNMISPGHIEVRAKTLPGARQTTLHEAGGHLVANEEGFAQGTSTAASLLRPGTPAYKIYDEGLTRYRQNVTFDEFIIDAQLNTPKTKGQYDKTLEMWSDFANGQIEVPQITARFKNAALERAYRENAGEKVAGLIEQRSDLSKDELPWLKHWNMYDVPIDKQIVQIQGHRLKDKPTHASPWSFTSDSASQGPSISIDAYNAFKRKFSGERAEQRPVTGTGLDRYIRSDGSPQISHTGNDQRIWKPGMMPPELERLQDKVRFSQQRLDRSRAVDAMHGERVSPTTVNFERDLEYAQRELAKLAPE
jgi:hypothetical protein